MWKSPSSVAAVGIKSSGRSIPSIMPTRKSNKVGGRDYRTKEDNLFNIYSKERFEEMRSYMDQVVKQQVAEQLARKKARGKKKEKPHHGDIPEFQRSIQPEEFLDWLGAVDEVFKFKEVPEKNKVET